MEIRKLQYFESVARLRNFTKAARELHVSQPTITTAIKRMEEELGVMLFVRDKRSVVLTCEGEIFLGKVQNILDQIDQAVLDMQRLSGGQDWTVNIGIVPISGAFLTSVLFKGFSSQYPQVCYKIFEVGTYGIMDAIDADQLDLGYLILQDGVEERYDICRIRKLELKVLVHKEHPLAAKQRLTIEEIGQEKLIYYPDHSFIRKKMDAQFQRCGIQPKILIEPVQMISVYSLVQNNVGISFCLGDIYQSLARTEQMVSIPLAEPIYCETGFVWKKGKRLGEGARKCLAFVQEQCKSILF